ncbi:MAG: hypothetical protein Phog2KO_30800 [Phototrophicaceae bacterium]
MSSASSSKSIFNTVDDWIISPSKHVPELEQRDARLVTSLAIVLVIAFSLRLLFTSTVDNILIGSCIAMIIAYGISRTRYHQLSAFIIIALLIAPTVGNLLDTPPRTDVGDWVIGRVSWFALPLVFASIFFSWRGILSIGLGIMGILALIPTFSDVLTFYDMIGSLSVVGILTALLVLAERHHDSVENDRRAELIKSNRALTDIKRTLEKRVDERTSELNEALKAAQYSDQVKSAFLASMSHELRTPLNSVINFTKFVVRGVMGPVTERQVETLNKVVGSGQHLLSLINDVLDMSKIESGSLSLFIEDDVDINAILETVISTGESLRDEKPFEIQKDIQENLPAMRVDRKRITQILLNVVSNACKFTEEGFVKVEAKVKDKQLYVSVKDTGAGIAKEDYDSVFLSFKQTDTGLRQGEGTGLGMPISKSLAEAHGGKLWFESEVGKGTIFYVTLPLDAEIAETIG